MELILISSNKMKVILDDDEMKKYKLSEECDLSLVSGKRQFAALLEEIKKKSGFDTRDHSVYIELFESLRGGCEIFITREKKSALTGDSYIKKDLRESIIIYKFKSAEDLILASKRLLTLNANVRSQLRADESGAFYLYIGFPEGYSFYEDIDLIFLGEYGERMSGEVIKLYLTEHGNTILHEDAIGTLSKL